MLTPISLHEPAFSGAGVYLVQWRAEGENHFHLFRSFMQTCLKSLDESAEDYQQRESTVTPAG